MSSVSKKALQMFSILLSLVLMVGVVVSASKLSENKNQDAENQNSSNPKNNENDSNGVNSLTKIKIGEKTFDLTSLLQKKYDSEKLLKLENMEELLAIFNANNQFGYALTGGDERNEIAVDMGAQQDIAPTNATGQEIGKASDGGYSSVNSQVDGVAEGDITVTDGNYIYSAVNDKIKIVLIDGKEISVVSTIDTNQVAEMYIVGDKLVTVSYIYEEINDENVIKDGAMRSCILYPSRQLTAFTVYDVSNRNNPVLFREFKLDGGSIATRIAGNKLYFVTQKYNYGLAAEEIGDGDILPMYCDTTVSDKMVVYPVNDIYYFPNSNDTSYMMVGAFDISSLEPATMDSYLGAGGIVYMNSENLYIARQGYENDSNYTELYRFSIDGVNVEFQAKGRVNGYIINQYSMDEHNNHLRVATTEWNMGNVIYVFDHDMNIVGQTDALAQNETIQSVRFMGDVGYMVTYEFTDPLFVLDLSNPTNPLVTGELKIPGFSQYLHPVGENYVIGFGRHTEELYAKKADGTYEVVGSRDGGAKISLFDVSDVTAPKEIDVMLLGENTYSDAFHNPRAMMVDKSRELFGFSYQGYSSKEKQNSSGFMIIKVSDAKLDILKDIECEYSYMQRLNYSGNAIYCSNENGIIAYDYNNFSQIGSMNY